MLETFFSISLRHFLYIPETIEGVLGEMRAILRLGIRLMGDCRGATAVEYGLILALIVLAVMGALIEVGGVTTGVWTNVSTKVQATH